MLGVRDSKVNMKGLLSAMALVGDDLSGHVRRVSGIAGEIGRSMDLPSEDIDRLRLVGALHDVGKVHVDPAILNKPGPLEGTEVSRMRLHPEIGFAMTLDDYDRHITEAILFHHERWDGSGYPLGLHGTNIPRLARVVLVADAFDAITNDRCYQPARSVEHALSEIRRHAGTQFDPEVAAVFVEMIESQASRPLFAALIS